MKEEQGNGHVHRVNGFAVCLDCGKHPLRAGFPETGMAHTWRPDKKGEPDTDAWEYDDPESMGGHNGVSCAACDGTVCVHCVPDWPDLRDCPGSSPS